jgi:hypothetical protein
MYKAADGSEGFMTKKNWLQKRDKTGMTIIEGPTVDAILEKRKQTS